MRKHYAKKCCWYTVALWSKIRSWPDLLFHTFYPGKIFSYLLSSRWRISRVSFGLSLDLIFNSFLFKEFWKELLSTTFTYFCRNLHFRHWIMTNFMPKFLLVFGIITMFQIRNGKKTTNPIKYRMVTEIRNMPPFPSPLRFSSFNSTS